MTASGDRPLRRVIDRAKECDEDAIRYLYCRYADGVYGSVLGLVRDAHEAEDVTQSLFAKPITVIR